MTNFKTSLFLLVFIAAAFSFTDCAPASKSNNESKTAAAQASIDGTYTGVLTYMGASGQMMTNVSGTAKIIENKNGTYDITFSDDVPALKGLKFKNKNGTYATVASENSVAGIDIDNDELTIGVLRDGNSWAFSGEIE